jgi:extracellular elastinolytic metalloproteinase
MGREIDRRDFTFNRTTTAREAELDSLAEAASERLSGAHRVRIRRLDATTGNPSEVTSEYSPAETGNYLQRALEHVQSISHVLGLTTTQPAEFNADPGIQRTSSGAVAVHLQQLYKGIPIFQAAETVRFSPDGRLKETVGSSVSVADELSVSPELSAGEAVMKAAQHIAEPYPDEQGAKDQFGQPFTLASVDLGGFEPQVITAFPEKPDQPTVFERGPFGDIIKASLLWFPLDGTLLLAWEVLMAMPDNQEQYRTLVDAESGEIFYCRQLTQFIVAQGNVYHTDGGSQRQMTDFPRPLSDYGMPIPDDLPAGFPDDWVDVQSTVGNSTNAHLDDNGSSMDGAQQGGVLTFDPAGPTDDEQKVLNIFYYNGVMHDYFYLLGFREDDGNFQRSNFGRGGSAFDRVDARAHSGAVKGTANMGTPIDGHNPVMNMGLVVNTNRHTAFDSSVVFHEFTHGVTNRLVGGPANVWALEAHQSGGMGEGWGDYIACTINNSTVVGDWVVDDPRGIRDFPYDSDFPDNFGDLGSGRYSGFTPQGKFWPHPIGEIWCATLLEMNRNIGANLGVQLVVDSLKLTPATPGFLDARNAILAALDDMRDGGNLDVNAHETAWRGIWEAFAKFGMGPDAQSNGASLSGIVADFNTPPFEEPEPEEFDIKVEASPNLEIPDDQPAGVSNVLTITETGGIARMAVSVDIEHTYIGDLQVSLTSPQGSTVVLHNRSGVDADNLLNSYSSDDLSALGSLLGEDAQGDWSLHVADHEAVDVGTLRHWSLEMDLEQTSQTVHGEATPGQTIPDNDANGISSSINIAQSGAAQQLVVSVDITHTFIGDLRVELAAPSGGTALLHDQSGGGDNNLIRSYDSASHPVLAALVGESVEGDWTLRVADLLGQDVGKFNSWSLELTLQ